MRDGTRLDSWKVIAAYLGRDPRTVRRWEHERRLPVHRIPGGKRQAVFAIQEELDEWLLSNPSEGAPGPEPNPAPSPAKRASRGRAAAIALLGGLCVLGAAWAARGLVGFGRAASRWEPPVCRYWALTNDGLAKAETVVSDGKFVYYEQTISGESEIRKVPVEGGPSARVGDTMRGVSLYDYLPNSQSLLIGKNAGGRSEREFWVLPLAGGQPQDLGLQGTDLKYSRDGQSIAWVEGAVIHVAAAAATAQRSEIRLPVKPIAVSWAANGNLFVNTWDSMHGRHEVWEVNSRSGTYTPGIPAGLSHPAVLPNSPTLLLVLHNDTEVSPKSIHLYSTDTGKVQQVADGPMNWGPPAVAPRQSAGDEVTAYAVGSMPRARLVNYEAKSGELVSHFGIPATTASFSRDGEDIAYISSPDHGLWVCRKDGSQRRRLTPPGILPIQPRWSPDGRRIAFAARPITGEAPWRIHVLDTKTGQSRLILNDAGTHQAGPAWWQGGQSVVFGGAPWLSNFSDRTTPLREVDITGGAVRAVAGSEGLWAPKTSPDGRRLLAESADMNSLRAYEPGVGWRMFLDLGKREIDNYDWSPDGRYVYFNVLHEYGALYRAAFPGGAVETVLRVAADKIASPLGAWFGLAPGGSVVFSVSDDGCDIYALNIKL